MVQPIKLKHFDHEGNPRIVEVLTPQIIVGREPGPGGLIINHPSVSREHGIFYRYRTAWIYLDRGSKNGSRINDAAIPADVPILLRHGDRLAVGDQKVTVELQPPMVSSVLAFRDASLVDEYLIPQVGRALTIGGKQCDISLRGYRGDEPALIVEGRGDFVQLMSPVGGIAYMHRGRRITSKECCLLADRDHVTIEDLHLVIGCATFDRSTVTS